VYTTDEAFNLVDPPNGPVRISVSQFKDMQSLRRITKKLADDPVVKDFLSKMDVECYEIVEVKQR